MKKHLTSIMSVVLAMGLVVMPTSELSLANNLAIDNVRIIDQDETNDTIVIEFDIQWDNAWKDSTNNDAAWVWFKYNTDSPNSTTTDYNHVTLNASGTNPTGFSDGTKQAASAFVAMDLIVPKDKKGLFIQPKSLDTGSVDFHDVQVVWDYGEDGVTDSEADNTITEVHVMGLEMTYIPEGGFYAGGFGGGTYGDLEWGSLSSSPGYIGSEAALEFSNDEYEAWYYNTTPGDSNDDANGTIFTVSENFPKGFNAFYMMKYELSQGMWRDFFNLLSRGAQNIHSDSSLTGNDKNDYIMVSEGQPTVSYRQTIKPPLEATASNAKYIVGCDLDDDNVVNESDDGEWLAMNHIHWPDAAAFLDWSALRPMTELEYVKAAQGPIYPISSAYAPCNDTNTPYDVDAISNNGTNSEVRDSYSSGCSANLNWDGEVTGPMRNGFAATSSTVGRIVTGAGYYGNMELLGNVYEFAVTLGNSHGRGFAGTHGDGQLTTNSINEGSATNPDWPGFYHTYPTYGVYYAYGTGVKWGYWGSSLSSEWYMMERYYSAYEYSTRSEYVGIRGGRTSPEYES
jgi:formylglycine-generating enzyme required for sulfatase activity